MDLESWRGKKFVEADFGPGGFDVSKLLGVACLIGITHTEKDGRTYANITSVSKMLKGSAPPTQTNKSVFFSLSEPDWSVFDTLSDGLKSVIQSSPEYTDARKGGQNIADDNGVPFNDEIPF